MFTQSCFIRNANKNLIHFISTLGYTPMYKTYRLNKEGSNLVLEGVTWHFTDSDNHPGCIDCGTNEELFLALAALQDDTDEGQWFVYPESDYWFKCDVSDIEAERNDPSTKMSCQSAWFYKSHKATPEELIKHFNHE